MYFLLQVCYYIIPHRKAEDQLPVDLQDETIPASGNWKCSLNRYLWEITLNERYRCANIYQSPDSYAQ